MLNSANPDTVALEPGRPAAVRPSLLSLPNRKRDRAAKQKALLQAALRLFATKGYEVTTTREIATAAGCAEGLIHRYFKGKAGLLSALIEYQTSEELTAMRQMSRTAPGLEEEFLQLVDWEIEHLWKNRNFLKLFISRAMVDASIASVLQHAVLSSRTQVVMERLKRHRDCAEVSEQELEALAQCVGILGLVFGFMRPMVLGQDRSRAKEMATSLAALLVRGLGSRKRA